METDVIAGGKSRPGISGLDTNRQRILPTEMLNARELGGYPVTDTRGRAKQVKWGLLYRTGELYGYSEDDKRLFEERGIKTVVDFRSEEEQKDSPELMPRTVQRVVKLPIDAGNLMGKVYSAENGWPYASSSNGAVLEMEMLYTALPGEAIPKYRVFFSLLSDPANVPLLFHCTAGKDRTGFAAALLLHALGAGRETIFEDYLISASFLQKRYRLFADAKPQMIPYWTVQESYLQKAFAGLEEYGGIDRYIKTELGADIERLQSLYTE